MRLFKLFARRPSIDHPVLGSLELRRGKRGPYWMHDTYNEDEVALSFRLPLNCGGWSHTRLPLPSAFSRGARVIFRRTAPCDSCGTSNHPTI